MTLNVYDACGRLKTAPSDFFLEVAQGLVPGVGFVHKFGRNPDIDLGGGFEAIWNGGGDYTGHDATAAETVEVFSSSATDNSAGSGARTLEVYGLDSSWAEQSEVISLSGATPVDTANTYIRMNRMIVRTAGGNLSNAGTLTARQNVTTANVFAVMPVGYNQTMIAAYTIPNGKTGHLMSWYASFSGNTKGVSDVRFLARPEGEVFQVKEELSIFADGSSFVQRGFDVPKGSYAEKTDIVITADSDTNNVAISAAFDLLLVDT